MPLASPHPLPVPPSPPPPPPPPLCPLSPRTPGDVWPSAALASCLAARAFRRELVLLTESRLAPAYQTFANLLDVGYEHVVSGGTGARVMIP